MPKRMLNLQTVSRSIDVLRCFENRSELRLTEIASELGLAKSTVFGIVATLENHRFLEQDERTGRYRLGIELFRLGTKVRSDLLNLAKPHMEKLVAEYRETVHLVVPDQCNILYIHKIESPHSMRICSKVGERQPLYCTAVGKTILAYLSVEEREKRMAAIDYRKLTAHTIVDREVLCQQLAAARQSGVAYDLEELEKGLTCIAAPILDVATSPVAAISVAGPTVRMTPAAMKRIKNGLLAATAEISAMLGFCR